MLHEMSKNEKTKKSIKYTQKTDELKSTFDRMAKAVEIVAQHMTFGQTSENSSHCSRTQGQGTFFNQVSRYRAHH